jgi:hypothetical protein
MYFAGNEFFPVDTRKVSGSDGTKVPS